jgi:hypothetical protein
MNLNINKMNEKMPGLHLHLKVEKDGEVISDSYQIGHSWTKNAYHWYNATMMDCTFFSSLPIQKTNGLVHSAGTMFINRCQASGTPTFTNYGYYNNNADNVDFGIVLGSNNTAYNVDDYRMYAPILSGNTAGKLYAQAQAAPVQSFSGSPDNTVNTLHSRVFNNNSGGTITVNEVGIVYKTYNGSVSGITTHYLLFSRDVLESPVTVLNGAQLTVTVSITTLSLDDLYTIPPDFWTAGMGGYFLGQYTCDDGGGGSLSHRKYALIVAPKSGGESTALALASTGFNMTADLIYGGTGTAELIAAGANSPLGQFCSAENTAVLGGYSDWYIPSLNEAQLFYDNRANIPAGQEFTNANYWTSSEGSFTAPSTLSGYRINPTTGSYAYTSSSTSYMTRLVRRILLADWVAD